MTATHAFDSAAMFAAADAYDLDTYIGFMADDVRFRFGNADEIHGAADMRTAVHAFFQTIQGLEHTVLREYHEGDEHIQKLSVRYTRLDGGTVTIPAMNVLRVAGDRVTDYQIYVDLAPVYA